MAKDEGIQIEFVNLFGKRFIKNRTA